jgi:hypothetical protein
MRRAIVHIGMPRSGSTSFQYVLASLRDALAGVGILYPDLTPQSADQERHLNHQHFGETLDNRRPRHERRELLQNLSDMLSRHDGDTVILSYEDFIQQQPRFGVPELLKDVFAKHGFTAEALVVPKPQSDLLNSIYTLRAQMIREYQSFMRFAPAFAGSRRFEYDALIAPWMTAFSGWVRAIPFRDRRSDDPIILRLFKEIELDDRVGPILRPDHTARVMNRSPGPLAIEISRRMRMIRMHARVRVLPRQVMRFVEREAADRGFDREKFYGVPAELRNQMETRYREVNDRFARAVWAKDWDDIVAPEPKRAVNELADFEIDPRTEWFIQEIIGLAARKFEVVPRSSIFDRPINSLVANIDALQRRIGNSQWRVL